MRRKSLLPFALCLLPSLALAQGRPIATPKDRPDETASENSRFSLTVYSTADPATFEPQQFLDESPGNPAPRLPGYALVRQTRKMQLNPGENQVKLTGVPASIDPTTVSFRSLTAPDSTTVFDQSYAFDLASPDKLLERYVGKNIIINRKQDPLPGDRTRMPETIEARLLAVTADHLVLETNNKQLPVQIIPRNQDITEIKLFDLKTGLATRPTLSWTVNAQQAGEHDVLVSYQTDNITWRADYTLTVNKDDTAADLSAWVTLVNQSGAAYPNAALRLVAGDVQRIAPQRPMMMRAAMAGAAVAPAAEGGFAERPFFEYHLYTLGRPVSIPSGGTKQIELFPARANVPVTRTYVYAGQGAAIPIYASEPITGDFRDRPNTKVDVHIQVHNTEKNSLGLPLPAGRVRVYKRDDAGAQADDPTGQVEFIGEDRIDHTPKDQDLLVRVGSAFDVVGERKQTSFNADTRNRTITESFEIKLRNHKDQPVHVIVKETLFRWTQWQITDASDKFEKHDARTMHIPVDVPAGGEKLVTYIVKYTW
ncbi:MAG TPA: DUF4139 domain-containing protein [Tepidisphaeraceae bacterium]|jgi:hypothetical protein